MPRCAAFACDTNTDIKEFVPQVIECILQPDKVPETVHNLAGCVFVQEVFGSPTLPFAPRIWPWPFLPLTLSPQTLLTSDPSHLRPFSPLTLLTSDPSHL